MSSVPFKKCDSLFENDKLEDGYTCIKDKIEDGTEFSSDKFDYIDMVYEDMTAPKAVCDWVDDHFIDVSALLYGKDFHEEMYMFLRDNCEDFRNVYHGTSVTNALKSDGWLCPNYGKFVDDMYGGDYGDLLEKEGVVFATDKKRLRKAINAISHHTEDIWGKGKGVLLKLDVSYFDRAGESGWADYPIGVEPNDYFTDACVDIEGVLLDSDLYAQIDPDNPHEDIENTRGWMTFDEFKEKYG